MFFIKDSCPVCRTGLLGIRRCTDEQNLVVMCDECETVWESPTLISTTNALDAEPPNFEVASLGIAIATGSSGWAGQEEINAKGWSSFVKGEQLSE
jgi:hypothetical protein